MILVNGNGTITVNKDHSPWFCFDSQISGGNGWQCTCGNPSSSGAFCATEGYMQCRTCNVRTPITTNTCEACIVSRFRAVKGYCSSSTQTCGTCKGDKIIVIGTPCEHEKTSEHYYCEHNNDSTVKYHEV